MCGIAGFISQKHFKSLKACLPVAVSGLAHRGPDDSGLFFDGENGVGLGHRRLSIIDLSTAGKQPMTDETGTIHIVFNGEIYNFARIRNELETLGCRFATKTDTEVILNAYRQWGIACLDRFIGMFAFAIWDSRQKCLYLVRDRLGIKPLYYHLKNDLFLFGSELKALMCYPEFKKNLDTEAFPLFLEYQYVPAPKTVFENTHKLEPGQYLRYTQDGVSRHAYWDALTGTRDSENRSEAQWVSELDSLLTTAVSDRLISDVPLGAFLSGGIDSSIVVALMQKISPNPVRTFSIGFGEDRYNEAPWAGKVAKHLKTDHTEFYVTAKEALGVIPDLPEIFDEPFADSSAVPTFLVSRLARSHVTVALSGDGGDEQFAGYVRYWTSVSAARMLGRFPKKLKNTAAGMLSYLSPESVERVYAIIRHRLPRRFQFMNFPGKWQKAVRMMRHGELEELYHTTVCIWTPEEIRELTGRLPIRFAYENAFRKGEQLPPLSRLMYVDRKTYLPDAMLTKVDRASMAVGLEVRVPLLDHRVVELTGRIPESLLYRGGTGKYLLKQLLGRYVPKHLIERPKMGFGIPLDQWFRNELKELLRDCLSYDRIKNEGLCDPDMVLRTLQEHLSGKFNHQHPLWVLLMWQLWREKWMNGG